MLLLLQVAYEPKLSTHSPRELVLAISDYTTIPRVLLETSGMHQVPITDEIRQRNFMEPQPVT